MADLNRIRELLLAAAEGDLETLSQVDPELLDVCNDEGNTLLMSSCANGKEAVVRHLLNPKFNVKIDAANVYGWTALMQACYYGHTAVVGVLLDKGADINLMNSWGATPLLAATQSGNMTLVKMLIQHKASVTPCDKSPTQFTPLMAAAQNGHEGITAVLLNNSADPNVQLAGSKYTALMFATLNGHMSLVRLLLKHGADKEMESSSSQKSVAIAGAIGREDIARLLGYSRDTDSSSSLIQNNLVPDGGVDIFTAVQTGDRMLRTVQRMVGASPDLVNAKDGHGATPLMYASMKGSVQVCRFLLEHGADVNCQDSVCEWTAFMQAVHHGQYVVAKLLIDYKADINLKAKEGCSAAEIATCNGDMKMLQLIMKYSKVPVLKETGTEDGTRGQGNNTHESLHHWMAQMNERLGNIPMKDHLLLRPDIVQITPSEFSQAHTES
jgi:serine/threonine-protein phosphatase 6 regulatory ankyrin repeat subunit B